MDEQHSDTKIPAPREEACPQPKAYQRVAQREKLTVAYENLSIAISEAFPMPSGLRHIQDLAWAKVTVMRFFDAAK